MLSPVLVFVVAIPALAGLAAAVCLILVERGGVRADAVVRRYPLALVTWLIAGPFLAATLFGSLVLMPISEAPADLVSFSLVAGLVAALCVAVIVLGHKMSRGRSRRPWLLLSIASPGIVVVLYGFVLAVTATMALESLALLLVAAGSIANGILAVRVHAVATARSPQAQTSIDAA